MTPKTRFLTTVRGGVADRVPLELAGFQFTSREYIDAHPDPLRRKVAHRVHDETHTNVQVPSHINRYLITPPQAMRSESRQTSAGITRTEGIIETPRGELTFVRESNPISSTSWQVKYPVETEEDIGRIASVPWERPEKLAPPGPDPVPAALADRALVETRISSPLVCVAGMMRYEMFLELALTRRELILELTEICLQRTLDVLEVLLSRPGIEYVWLGGSEWVTPPMASPSLYDALVQEQERTIISAIQEKSDAVVHIHCHGHGRHALQRTVERGAHYTEPVEPPPDGDITMAEAKQLADGRITLGGNIECRVLCNEDEDAVERAVRAAFEGGKERFVLRPTEGPSPRMSEGEFRNYMRLVDVWEELSPI